jgi:hypothetical protein
LHLFPILSACQGMYIIILLSRQKSSGFLARLTPIFTCSAGIAYFCANLLITYD